MHGVHISFELNSEHYFKVISPITLLILGIPSLTDPFVSGVNFGHLMTKEKSSASL